MSEYWKSTPKYWCKHCKTFVRDTKLEKQNHEATPKHQGNLQRFLRDLHRGHEREERDIQRAKDEVARLNGITGAVARAGNAPSARKSAIPTPTDKATQADRKRQLQQLADMGVAVPEEARREMAMAGDWQTQSVTPTYEQVGTLRKEEDYEEHKASALAVGVRKRKFEGDEEKEEAAEGVVKTGWGFTTRTWQSNGESDLEALFETTRNTNPKLNRSFDQPFGTDAPAAVSVCMQSPTERNEPSDELAIKREDVGDEPLPMKTQADFQEPMENPVKSEEDVVEPGVVFKKRKAKPIRPKA